MAVLDIDPLVTNGMSAQAWEDFCFAYGIDMDDFEHRGRRAQDASISIADIKAASQAHGASLLYGELLPHGLMKALRHLGADTLFAGSMLELGSGSGKLALQAALSLGISGHLRSVLGVELAPSRHSEAVRALRRLVQKRPELYAETSTEGRVFQLRMQSSNVSVELRCDDFLSSLHDVVLANADILLLQVCIPPALYGRLFMLLKSLKLGARILSLLDLISAWQAVAMDRVEESCPVQPFGDGVLRLPTSWAFDGHDFFIFEAKTMPDSSHADGTKCLALTEVSQLCEGVQNGKIIPIGLLSSSIHHAEIWEGMAVEVAGAHCLRTPGAGARLFEDDEVIMVDSDMVDWLPAWVVGTPRSRSDCIKEVDVLHEDGTIEACVALERLRYPSQCTQNQFGVHRDGVMKDTE